MVTTTVLNPKRKRRRIGFPGKEFLVVLLAAPNLSMTWLDSNHSLLTEADFQLQESQDRPALSSVIGEEPGWESFNEWQCFPTDRVESYCAIHSFPRDDGKTDDKRTPTLRISTDSDEIMDFDYDNFGSFDVNCDSALWQWRQMLDGTDTLCLYGAYLQDIADGEGYWILERMKTGKGFWPPAKEENDDDLSSDTPPESADD
jgi:hypothetical protein